MSAEQFGTESVFGVLVYLFEHHLDNKESPLNTNQLTNELEMQGFSLDTIYKALDWIDDLILTQNDLTTIPLQKDSLRIFTADECEKISVAARDFIMQLEHNELLTPQTRELTIAQVMKLDQNQVDLEQTKWIILMVLFNQPDQEKALLCFEYITADNKKDIN